MWANIPPGGARTATIGLRFATDAYEHIGRVDVVLKAMRLKANDVNRRKLLSALLDPAFDLDGAIAFGTDYVVDNVKDPLGFASCFPTAEHLFPILAGVTPPNAAFCGRSNDLAMLPDADAFRAEVGRLVARLRAYEHAGTEAVCRIEFAGHGFTLVLRTAAAGPPAMHIEVIESLAHSCAIHKSLRRRPLDFTDACDALVEMADDDYPTREEGAGFFGWNAEAIFLHDAGDPEDDDYPLSSYDGQVNAAPGEYFPCTKMKWWCHPLAATAVRDWCDLAERRLASLERAFPGKPQGGREAKRTRR